MDGIEDRVKKLSEFKRRLLSYDEKRDPTTREWLNQNTLQIRREVSEAGCAMTFTIAPPPAVGGLILHDVDPFASMFDRVYLMSMTPHICDMIDRTIGVLRNPPPKRSSPISEIVKVRHVPNYAFVAMSIDKDDHQLVDVLDAIKEGAAKCEVKAERVDDVESNDRITDRILESIQKAEFVIVDLTNERPNVFFEAGYAHGLGKTPVYVARDGTKIHFDVKDYPVIFFKNMKELREGITKRLVALAKKRTS